MDKQPVVLIIGSTPEDKAKPIEVYLDQEGADRYILRGLLGAFANHLEALEPGGTLSLIVNRAPEAEDNRHPSSSGSFVINNVKGDRHVWDFNTIYCEAQPSE